MLHRNVVENRNDLRNPLSLITLQAGRGTRTRLE
jgi:hypothetical protein